MPPQASRSGGRRNEEAPGASREGGLESAALCHAPLRPPIRITSEPVDGSRCPRGSEQTETAPPVRRRGKSSRRGQRAPCRARVFCQPVACRRPGHSFIAVRQKTGAPVPAPTGDLIPDVFPRCSWRSTATACGRCRGDRGKGARLPPRRRLACRRARGPVRRRPVRRRCLARARRRVPLAATPRP
jgi:hypothetical protein